MYLRMPPVFADAAVHSPYGRDVERAGRDLGVEALADLVAQLGLRPGALAVLALAERRGELEDGLVLLLRAGHHADRAELLHRHGQ